MNEEQRLKYTEIIKNALSKAKSEGYIFPYSEITIYKMDLLFGEYRGWLENIIFSHEWASAFFGKKSIKVYGGIWNTYSENPTTVELHEVPAWQHYLQQMVLLPTIEERLEYINSFL